MEVGNDMLIQLDPDSGPQQIQTHDNKELKRPCLRTTFDCAKANDLPRSCIFGNIVPPRISRLGKALGVAQPLSVVIRCLRRRRMSCIQNTRSVSIIGRTEDDNHGTLPHP